MTDNHNQIETNLKIDSLARRVEELESLVARLCYKADGGSITPLTNAAHPSIIERAVEKNQ